MGELLQTIDGLVWGNGMIFLLVGTGIILTIITGVIQVRKFPRALKITFFSKPEGEGDISPFQALATSLSATIGTGNIAGVATAIVAGGPGAVFWMWITAVFGGATKFAEAVLALKYRKTNDKGEQIGGPMFYIEKGIKERYGWNFKWLASLFAIFAVIASFGIGNMTQSNSIAASLNSAFNIPLYVSGLVVALLVGVVIIGGIKSIANVADKVVPGMALFYVIGSLIVLFMNVDQIGEALSMIFSSAFSGKALAGGALGTVIAKGVSRGAFSNEAGLGSAAIAHAASTTKSPYRQGLVASLGTFIDTIVICTMTALVILTSGLVGVEQGIWSVTDGVELIAHNGAGAVTGAALTGSAFEATLGNIGQYLVAVGLAFFAFSTILGWFYYSSKSLEYLTGTNSVKFLKILFPILVFLGSIVSLDAVWTFSSIANGLMALPNLVGILLLLPVVHAIVKRGEE